MTKRMVQGGEATSERRRRDGVSGKSQQGGLAPSSFRTTGGVHELVARAVRGKYVRQMIK